MTDFPSAPPSRSTRSSTVLSLVAASALIVGTLAAFIAITPPAAEALGLRTGAMAEASSPHVDHPQTWTWPVPPPIRVVSPFRAPPTPYAAGHRGIDLEAAAGAVVTAPAAGTVSFAGTVAGRGVVAIDHGDGVVSAIEPVEALVGAGTSVTAGDSIGTVASGGHCASECVHFGVRVHGEYVSPFLFLGGLPRAVLLPTL
ncbi:M23 family metallopeptidase [Agromyces sp. ISL-38]|uniref:M23 family metallopeptidase n=1 Tax=Agromyces sp. ISL-38 TaxID=2819107 RepID=UPI001BE6A744|nr:M23 family metallopeptidase [Agromyces sp. ISL-38]MBT2499741.1 M23 family metallopeptidase [Agromyces sp. ISL-38]MBT2516111.1 M23 family metallopeptidase [Streptomyces sp. ISL-90]